MGTAANKKQTLSSEEKKRIFQQAQQASKNSRQVVLNPRKKPAIIDNGGIAYFHLEETNDKGKVERINLEIPYKWQNNISDDDNYDRIRDLEERYTKFFAARDREAKYFAINGAFMAGDISLTIINELINTNKLNISEWLGEKGEEALQVGAEFAAVKSYDLEKDSEAAMSKFLALVGGFGMNSEEDAVELYEEITKQKPDIKKVGDLLSNAAGEFFAVYGPAIYTLKQRGLDLEEEPGKYLTALHREITLNRISACVMSTMMGIGFQIMRMGTLGASLIGISIIASSVPIAEGVRTAAEEVLEPKEEIDEAALKECLDAAEVKFKETFDLTTYLGYDKMNVLFSTESGNPDEVMIAELEVDAPGAWEGMKIIAGDVFNQAGKELKKTTAMLCVFPFLPGLMLKTIADPTSTQPADSATQEQKDEKQKIRLGDVADEIKDKVKIKGINNYYGTVSAVGPLTSAQYENGKNQNFVAFFDTEDFNAGDVMRDLIKATFEEVERTEEEKLLKQDYVEYEVMEGDVLSELAVKFGTEVDLLAEINEIENPDQIQAGDRLIIPPLSYRNYKVKDSDALSQIAQKYGTTVEALRKLNNIQNRNEIKEKETLIVPYEYQGAYKDLEWTSFKEAEANWKVPRLIHRIDIAPDYYPKHYNSDEDTLNHILVHHTDNDALIEKLKNNYLQQLKNHFCVEKETTVSRKYLRRLLMQGIEVGVGKNSFNWDYCRINHISIIRLQARKMSLGLVKTDMSYKKMLNLEHNQKFVEKGLVGKLFDNSDYEYDYIIFDSSWAKHYFHNNAYYHRFFQANHDKLYGSQQEDDSQEGIEVEPGHTFERYAGEGKKEEYQDVNGQGTIVLNEQEIGSNIQVVPSQEREREWKKKYPQAEEYEEVFYKENSEKVILKVKYFYLRDRIDVDSWIDLDYVDSLLVVHYGRTVISDLTDKLEIVHFRNGDYGINLPRYNVLRGTLNAKKVRYKETPEFNIDPEWVYNYQQEYEEEEKAPNQADKISLVEEEDKVDVGQDIEQITELEEEELEYKDEADNYYTFSLADDDLLIKYGNRLGRNRDNIDYGNAVLIEGFANGDYGLYFRYQKENIDCMMLYGTKNKEEQNNTGSRDYNIWTKQRKCNQKDECPHQEICKERAEDWFSRSVCINKGYIYNASTGKGNIYIDGAKISDIDFTKLVPWKEDYDHSDRILVAYKYVVETETGNLGLIYEHYLDENYDSDELVIRYGDQKGLIWIRDFENGDYNIELPPVQVSQIPGSKYRV